MHGVWYGGSAMENEANQANYDEVEGHLKLLNARLSKMLPSGSPGLSTVQDLEDYYERAVQLRAMQNTTLTEQLSETEQKLSGAQYKNKIAVRVAWFIVIMAGVFVAECVWPGVLADAASGVSPTGIASHLVVLCIALYWP